MSLGLQTLQPSMDYATLINILNQNFNLVDAVTTTQIFKDDSGTKRIQIGKGSDGVYRVLVSKPGVDVTTNVDPNQFLFNSDQNVFKIAKIMDIDVVQTFPPVPGLVASGGDNGQTQTTPHNLGFTPLVIWTLTNPTTQTSFTINTGDIIDLAFANNYSQTFWWQLGVTPTALTTRIYRRYWVNSGYSLNGVNLEFNIRAYLLQQSSV